MVRSPAMSPRIAIVAFALCLFASPAFAASVEPTATRDTAALAVELDILHGETSALLILATAPYDRVIVGLEGAVGTNVVTCGDAAEGTNSLGAGCIRAVAHPLQPGHLDVSVHRGEDSWSGALLLIAGDIAVLDVEALLRLAAHVRDPKPVEFEFDVAAFESKLAAREGFTDKTNYCRRVLAGLPEGDDRDLVNQLCTAAATTAAAEEADQAETLEAELAEDDGLDTPEVDPSLVLLYHLDGRPRLLPRGTIPRRIATIAFLAGVGGSVAAALSQESQAELAYRDFRQAERVGDDVAMSEKLFFTKQHDRNRDIAIGVGIGLTVTAFSFLAHQLLERRLFLQAKEAAESEAKLKGTE
jgi:hypothetical protein